MTGPDTQTPPAVHSVWVDGRWNLPDGQQRIARIRSVGHTLAGPTVTFDAHTVDRDGTSTAPTIGTMQINDFHQTFTPAEETPA